MAISTQIARLTQAKADIKAAIEAKGVTVPSSAKLDDYDTYVGQISGGGGNRWPSMEPDNTLPSGYTRLVGLRRVTAGAFINTGVLADSTTGFDIEFSMESNGSPLQGPAFGIRRLAGNSDTAKVGLYVKPDSYFSAFSVIYGSTDSGFITGSGCGTVWGGNHVKVSCRGGKWYVWGRLIYDGSSDTFSNSDNCPFFLGTAAKSATAAYNNNTNLHVFFSAKFYDGNDTLTHDFVPAIDPEGKVGLYDKVAQSFILPDSQNNWVPVTPAERTYRSARLIGQLSKIRASLNYQSAVRYNGWIVGVTDSQRYFLLSNDKIELHSGTMTQTGVAIECSEYNSQWHGNTCWFGSEKYDPSDIFPILYVSTDKSNCLLIAYRISGSSVGDFAISIVQKIYTPAGDADFQPTLYCHCFYGKAGCSTFLETSMIGSTWSVSTGNGYRYRVFNLPSLSAGSEVTMSESDVIKKGSLPYMYGGSNGGWNGEYLYLSCAGDVIYVYKIGSSGAEMVRVINHSLGVGNPNCIMNTGLESEGLSWDSENGCFIMLAEPSYGNVVEVYAEDLEQYV